MPPINIESANAKLESAGIDPSLKAKWQSLVSELAGYESAVIAYSGGVDSGFLAYAAAQVLGERAAAVTVVSTVESASTFEDAARFAAQHGIRHETIAHDPLQSPAFRANPPDRCYHCKTSILHDLWAYVRQGGYRAVLEGQNADDATDYRPGSKAVTETGTFSPLAHNGLTKAEIRWLARALDLSIWNRPSAPCLATRIPYGTTITAGTLEQVARAEAYLRENGFETVRVRHYQDTARIEVDPARFAALLEQREDLVRALKAMGFLYVTLDLQGYRLGSLNEGLTR